MVVGWLCRHLRAMITCASVNAALLPLICGGDIFAVFVRKVRPRILNA